jgi:hypothetical protein
VASGLVSLSCARAAIMNGPTLAVGGAPDPEGTALLAAGVMRELEERVCILLVYWVVGVVLKLYISVKIMIYIDEK